MYTAAHIANYFLTKAHIDEKKQLTHLKLQKLVYIAYGWGLAVLNERIFSDPIEAWKHGPVIPSLYHEFKEYKSEPIQHLSFDYDLDDGNVSTPQVDEDDANTQIILDKVWDVYKNFSGWTLRDKTHEKNTPWSDTYDPTIDHKKIPDDIIKNHFKTKIEEYLNAADAA